MDQRTTLTAFPPVTTVTTTGANPDPWKYRRRFMFAITAFDMIVIVVALLFGTHQSVAEMAVLAGFASLSAIFAFYVVGATYDDHSSRQFQIQALQAMRGAPDDDSAPAETVVAATTAPPPSPAAPAADKGP